MAVGWILCCCVKIEKWRTREDSAPRGLAPARPPGPGCGLSRASCAPYRGERMRSRAAVLAFESSRVRHFSISVKKVDFKIAALWL